MAFTPILIPQDFAGKGAMSLPDQPAMPAEDLKAAFDSPARQVCAPAFNRLITEMGAETAAASLGAEAPTGRTVSSKTVQAGLNKLSSDLTALETSTAPAIEDAHTHANKAELDKISEDENTGEILYNGNPVGETSYDALEDRPKINSHTLTGDMSTSDLGIDIPDQLSDLADDENHRLVTDSDKSTWNGKSVVSYTQTYQQAGQKIGEITINGVTTDLKAPSGGGGGGGGAVDSVNGQTGIVTIGVAELDGVSVTGLTNRDALIYDSGWKNIPLPISALSGSYGDLRNKPGNATTSASGFMSASDKTKLNGIASGAEVNVQSDWEQDDSTADDYIKNKPAVLGHTMNPTPSSSVTEDDVVNAVTTAVANDGGENDEVASLFGIANWSNTMSKTFLVKGIAGGSTPISQTGIGTWPADMDNPTAQEEATWIKIPALYGIGAVGKENIEVKIMYDPAKSGTVALGGWIIDDDTDTHTAGRICVKFANEISEADTHTAVVGIKIIINRTETVDVSTL